MARRREEEDEKDERDEEEDEEEDKKDEWQNPPTRNQIYEALNILKLSFFLLTSQYLRGELNGSTRLLKEIQDKKKKERKLEQFQLKNVKPLNISNYYFFGGE